VPEAPQLDKTSVLKRLIAPIVILGVFLVVGFTSGDLLAEFSDEALTTTRKVFSYALQIGIWLASAFLINRLMSVFFWDMVVSRAMGGGPVPRLLKDVVAAVVYIIAITGIVAFVFGESVTGIWATGGAVGLVLGFALRSLILDVFTGLAINIDRPYRIGDWIMLHQRQHDLHIIGNVQELNWRTTRLRTAHGNLVVVPNSVMGQTIITNYMLPEEHSRLELYFDLDFGVPSERALRVLTAAMRSVTGNGPKQPLLDPPPKIRINRITELGVEYRIRYWVLPRNLSPNRSRHIVIGAVLDHLKQAGLTLAYPKNDVFHQEMPQRHLDGRTKEDRVELLQRIELFANLHEDELDALGDRIEQRRFRDRETLIAAGEPGESMFILVEGLVYVFVNTGEGDEQVKVAQIVPGNFFGEMSLLTGEPRSATITAASDTIVYEIRKEHISALLGARPELAEELSRVVADRVLRNQKKLAEAPADAVAEEKRTVAGQIMGRMKAFFGF